MAKRKKRGAKSAPELNSDALASAVAGAVANALEPISQKLDAVLEGQQKSVAVDEDTLSLMGVDDPAALGDILDEAAEVAADQLEADGDPVAAAVIDAGLDTQDVIDELAKRRKAQKNAGGEPAPVTVEEAAEAIEEVAVDIAENMDPEEVQQCCLCGHLQQQDHTQQRADEPLHTELFRILGGSMAIQLIDLGREVSILPVEPDKIPYCFSVKLEDRTYRFTFKYNARGGFFTVDLETAGGEALVFGDILRYGRPLFGPVEDERYPLPVIIPLCPGGGESEITAENFGRSVKLYLYPREGPGKDEEEDA